MCDIYHLAEKAFNFPNMAFLRLSPKLVQNHLETFRKHYIHDSVDSIHCRKPNVTKCIANNVKSVPFCNVSGNIVI